ALLVNQYFWFALRVGALARGALSAAVFRQALALRVADAADSGQLANLLGSDCVRVSTLCGSMNMAWSAPLQLAVAFLLLWRVLGPPVLAGCVCMVAMLGLQLALASGIARLRGAVAAATDQRLRRTEAALAARQAVKLQLWEELCFEEVQARRRVEVAVLRREAMLKACSVLLATLAPTAVSLSTFTALTLSGRPLYAPSVFGALALFNAMRAPLSALPDLFSSASHAQVALRRFQKVLAHTPRMPDTSFECSPLSTKASPSIQETPEEIPRMFAPQCPAGAASVSLPLLPQPQQQHQQQKQQHQQQLQQQQQQQAPRTLLFTSAALLRPIIIPQPMPRPRPEKAKAGRRQTSEEDCPRIFAQQQPAGAASVFLPLPPGAASFSLPLLPQAPTALLSTSITIPLTALPIPSTATQAPRTSAALLHPITIPQRLPRHRPEAKASTRAAGRRNTAPTGSYTPPALPQRASVLYSGDTSSSASSASSASSRSPSPDDDDSPRGGPEGSSEEFAVNFPQAAAVVVLQDASFSWQMSQQGPQAEASVKGNVPPVPSTLLHNSSTSSNNNNNNNNNNYIPLLAASPLHNRLHWHSMAALSPLPSLSLGSIRQNPPCFSLGTPSPSPSVSASQSPSRLRVSHSKLPASSPTSPPALQSVTFSLRPGQLLAVVGGTGSGKSTLLMGLLGEVSCSSGEVQRNVSPGSLAYCGQQPSLVRGSLRENVLFGRNWDEQRYFHALDACGLRALDQAEADKQGSNNNNSKSKSEGSPHAVQACLPRTVPAFSGGQQARIALARAIYGRPELCLLDEPLASLDPTTSSQVWRDALRGPLLRRSAVVVSTASAHLAMAADQVLLLEAGVAVQFGPPARLAVTPGLFSDLLAEVDVESSLSAGPAPLKVATTSSASRNENLEAGSLEADNSEAWPPRSFPKAVVADLEATWPSLLHAKTSQERHPEVSKARRSLELLSGCGGSPGSCRAELISLPLFGLMATTSSQDSTARARSPDVYYDYASRFGGSGLFFIAGLGLFAAAQASIVLADCWLAHWSAIPRPQGAHPEIEVEWNLEIFALLALLAASLVALQAALWPLLSLRAASGLHAEGLRRVLFAPLQLEPAMGSAGQLLSPFSKDMDTLDSRLPAMLAQALACVAALGSAVAAIVASQPRIVPVAVILAWVLHRLTKVYRPVATEAARLVSALHGPVVAQLLEVLRCREYIRAFNQESRAQEQALALLEASARAQILSAGLQRWFALQLETLGAIMLFCIASFNVMATSSVHIGLSGLSLTYALTLTALAKYLVNYGTRADAQFASVERLQALTHLRSEQEEELVHRDEVLETTLKSLAPPSNWPERGFLELRQYQPAAHGLSNSPALWPLTLTVQPGEHIALIGRSGAGKSTLLAGLSRLLPVGSGQLRLDGRDANEVSLQRWRAALLCVPQEPLLLAGSVAHNLDPQGLFAPFELWEALRLVALEALVRALPLQLATQIGNGRPNGEGKESEAPNRGPAAEPGASSVQLSGGQRRLLVLARLLLRRQDARLVLLDEPAAGMEQQEVTRLHGVLQAHLGHAALIAVTHRLLPVLHLFSRVLVLSEGSCTEDGAPSDLLADPQSHLCELLAQAPTRLRAHVQRMLALHRLRGLPAIQKMLKSVNSQTPSTVVRPLAGSLKARSVSLPATTQA
ncbi:unnamed protein product, partial [Polarella glacialis]